MWGLDRLRGGGAATGHVPLRLVLVRPLLIPPARPQAAEHLRVQGLVLLDGGARLLLLEVLLVAVVVHAVEERAWLG